MRATNPIEERVVALIEPTAATLGFRIVRVRLSGQRRKRLQIMAERLIDGQMSVDDCTRLSRALSPVFDLEDPIQGEFDLEISSPGIDRPLMNVADFERFIGHEAKLETAAMIDGRRRWKGRIERVEGDVIVLATEQGEARLHFAALSDARLVLTDKLIAEDLKRARAAEAVDATPPLAGEVRTPAKAGGGERESPAAAGAPPLNQAAPDSSPASEGAGTTKRKDT